LPRGWGEFRRADYITEGEVLAIPHARVGKKLWRSMLRAADADGDGRISFKEMVYARMDFFDRTDTDRDGRLSRAEALKYDQRSANAAVPKSAKGSDSLP